MPARTTPPAERRLVHATPWPGVHGTWIDSARHYPRHWHDVYGIGLVEAGGQRSASDRGEVEAGPGQIITTNPGEVHDGRPLGETGRRWRMLYLDPDAWAGWSAISAVGTPLLQQLSRPVIDDGALAAALRQLWPRLDALATPDAPDTTRLAAEEALTRVMAALLTRHTSHPTRSAAVPGAAPLAAVRERLADASTPAPSLAELGALAGLSRWGVLRAFERHHGLPPHAWQLQWRTHRARAHIARGSGLAEAAGLCGFADQAHMTRAFVRFLGFTPGAWRQATRHR
jgi:AraC-like DNA-binding protein